MSRMGVIGSVAVIAFLITIALGVPAAGKHHTEGPDLYVGDLSPGDDGAPPYECGTREDPCDSLEHAVAHAAGGDVIALANGTLTSGPVTFDKNVTVEGARGPVKSVLKPAVDIAPGGAWLLVAPGAEVSWKMVTFDGTGHQVPEAIRYEGDGAVTESIFKEISAAGGEGTAIAALGGGITVYKTQFSAIGHTGVLLAGTPQSLVGGNRFRGTGTGLEYGIEVLEGAQAAIRSNTIDGYTGTGAGSASSAAIAVRGAAPATEAELTANDLRRSTVGLEVDGAGGEAIVTPRANAFVGNGVGVAAGEAIVDARDNWWGGNGGPGSDGSDSLQGAVEAPTWLTLTLKASPDEAPVAGTSVVTATLTRNSVGSPVAVPSLQPIESLESGRPKEEELAPMGFADGTSIAFSADGGFLASPVTTVGGSAGSTLTLVGPPGTATVRASLDAATVGVEVRVRQAALPASPSAPGRAAGGSERSDRLYGTRYGDSIEGFAGNDLLVGRAGDDRLIGGAGDDVAYGGAGDDLLLGQQGRDILNGGAGNDLVVGATGADILVGGQGDDVLAGNAGADRLKSADGRPGDVAACGAGFDVGVVDQGDVLSGCERVAVRSPRTPSSHSADKPSQ